MKINIQNYEEWMIDYLEGNLSSQQQKEFAEFLEFHPELKPELDLFRQTKLEPDMNIVFSGKEKLMQKETAKVITMGSWVRYAAAVAAVVMIFIGVRSFTGKKEELAIKQYNSSELNDGFAYDRKTNETEIKAPQENAVKHVERHFAEIKKEEIVPQQPEMKIEREENMAMEEIQMKKTKSIEIEFTPYNAIHKIDQPDNAMYAFNNQTDQSKYISLNDNTSIVDWMNDAVALGDEVGGLLESFILKDEKTETVNTPYKTTSVSLFGISYYSRKKSN